MISTRDFLATGPDDGSAYIGDPEANKYAPVRPAPVMPPACVPGYPEVVILALWDAHEAHVALGWAHYRFTSDETRPQRIMHRQLAVLAAARATAVVQCLRDAGHHADADALRENAAALEEALHAVPADLEERMDLMDAALPGERA